MTTPSTSVQLFFSCRSLPNKDTFSLSDPFIVVYELDNERHSYVEIGRTEVQNDTLNPSFLTGIKMQYRFERRQELRITIYDADDPKKLHDLSKHDVLGHVDFTMGQLAGSRGQTLLLPVLDSKRANPAASSVAHAERGTVSIRMEELVRSNGRPGVLHMDFHAHQLPKMDTFGSCDAYLVFHRLREDGSSLPVLKTPVVKGSLHPVFPSVTVTVDQLCGGDWSRPVLVECFDWDKVGKHDFIGKFTFSLDQLRPGSTFSLMNPDASSKLRSALSRSSVELRQFAFDAEYTMLEYLKAGFEVSMMVGIDFTASNGHPSMATSLHYLPPRMVGSAPSMSNPYEAVISTVGAIVCPYDSDQQFPVYGFGAKIPPTMQLSHCFLLDQAAVGVGGILDSYQRWLPAIELYGPTCFAPLLRETSRVAMSTASQKYYILLLVTDGEILDMSATVDAVVEASYWPLSIIIVGVGDGDFGNMHILDADEEPLKDSQGRRSARDIVQFVAMRDFTGSASSPMIAIERLAEHTLAELPGQFLDYMRWKRITPEMVAQGGQSLAPPLFSTAPAQ